ncbi:MAG TPA: prepilin-type N-terminal cleavage/methylation domain-containing protein [Syntrophorhabdaceae bacterium]|nr:prepilin-type N-terminal cleavage/methylation domain-containing protein [Syntrophorhabdaceae bacterium]
MSRGQSRGFTLIELIIFIVVGAIILPASFVAFTSAMKYFSAPDYYVKARFYTEQKMEELTSYTYTNIAVPTNPPNNDVPEANYQRNWTTSFIDLSLSISGSDVGYKKITVSTIMPDGSVYDASTIVTKRPKAP